MLFLSAFRAKRVTLKFILRTEDFRVSHQWSKLQIHSKYKYGEKLACQYKCPLQKTQVNMSLMDRA